MLSQIVYRLGEDEFNQLVKDLSQSDKAKIEMFLRFGLEYGDNDYDSKMDNKRIEVEFPTLMTTLTN